MTAAAFRFDYTPPTIVLGRGRISRLGSELAADGYGRALIVCGQTVGKTSAVIDPVVAGLEDRHVATFAETTPQKRLETALRGLDIIRERDIDVLVAVGGGSSLDIAKQLAALSGRDRPTEARPELIETGTFGVPADGLVPIVVVPTTLAGADLSIGAGVNATLDDGSLATGGISDPRLMPSLAIYDPTLVTTTPASILCGSAMNGFNKGIETIYARTASPITDATATEGLGHLSRSLPELAADPDLDTIADILTGIVCVQYGIARADTGTLSIIHAFGHGLSRTYPVQQGVAHAIVTPHILELVFEHVDARRERLATALGVGDRESPADAIVERVTSIRDSLRLPSGLRAVDGPAPDDFPSIARRVAASSLLENAPPGFEPTVEDLEGVLRAAY